MADHINPQTGEPATHHLPWTNGWSSVGQEPPTTWCGHCKAHIPITEEWTQWYYDKVLARFDHQVFRGNVRPRDEAPIREEIEKDRRYLLRLVLEAVA